MKELTKKAAEIINILNGQIEEGDMHPADMKDVLEDGEALASLGITDQEAVEDAHAFVCEVIEEMKEVDI